MTTTVEARPQATVFNLKTPVLSKGRTTDLRAQTDLMTAMIKVYAEGGENAMHMHPSEDHVFLVLDGEATFHLNDEGNAVVLHRYEAVLLPKGSLYRFESTGDENLVMFRVGAARTGGAYQRIDPRGEPIPGDSEANKHVEGVPLPGKFFGG